jgi:hypothetical protein
LDEVAVYIFTGTLTRPNDTDPFHIERIAICGPFPTSRTTGASPVT